jgi:hypothetical protein
MAIAKTIIAPSLLDPGNHALTLMDDQYLRLMGNRRSDEERPIGRTMSANRVNNARQSCPAWRLTQ